jgi:6-phosphogluconolactonase (cycloisomerase 2 family)
MRFTHVEAVGIRRPFMRTVTLGLAAVLLAAQGAGAGSILYATAATTGAVDGFCIRPDGSLAPTPKVHVATGGPQPRRLLVANDTLYVAEVDRIEAFPIGGGGVLKSPSSTKVTQNLDPRDLALAPDGKTLYATHHAYVSAYALAADGGLPKEFTSCVEGIAAANYLNVQVANGLLYVSADDAPGRIEVYGLNCDGSVPPPNLDGSPRPPESPCPSAGPTLVQTGCGSAAKKDRVEPPKWPYSVRTKIQKPKALVVAGDMIYVEEGGRHRRIS